ncbi:hypothetical protein BH18ACT17_BH18ACT17_04980 [soil metagenome]
MIGFRQADPRFPFLWESPVQPSARWHATGEGPVQYFSDTPEAAWAEFLRHEEIVDPADLRGVRRAMWVATIDRERLEKPAVSDRVARGGPSTYATCRRVARQLRRRGATGLVAPSAALQRGATVRYRVDGGLLREARDDAVTIALCGARPSVFGHLASPDARPGPDLVPSVRQLPGRR